MLNSNISIEMHILVVNGKSLEIRCHYGSLPNIRFQLNFIRVLRTISIMARNVLRKHKLFKLSL